MLPLQLDQQNLFFDYLRGTNFVSTMGILISLCIAKLQNVQKQLEAESPTQRLACDANQPAIRSHAGKRLRKQPG
jgi:hypothetical protein